MPMAIRVVDQLADQADVAISSPSTGQVLTYNGTKWANAAPGGGGSTIYTNAYASAPSSPSNGDQWWPSDGGGIRALRVAGAWSWFYKGWPITLPDNSTASWYNQRSSTVDASTGTIFLHAPADSTDSWSMRLWTLPSTPYSLVFLIEPLMSMQNYMGAGVTLRNSSTSDWVLFGHYCNSNLRDTVATAAATDHITTATYDLTAPQFRGWMKITDDGTTRKYSHGPDGQRWEQFYSQGHTASVTPNTYGIGVEARNSTAPAGLRLISLKEYNSVI